MIFGNIYGNIEDRDRRPKDETILVNNLTPCKCGKNPVVKRVATHFDYDPRCFGWEYKVVIECECGTNVDANTTDAAKYIWNKAMQQ